MSITGFWVVDVKNHTLMLKCLNPYTPTNFSSAPKTIYHRHENTKKLTYETRIREVGNGTFTPLVSQQWVGWLTKQLLCSINVFPPLLSEKRNEH